MTTSTTPITTTDTTPPAELFLTAVLMKDVVTLRTFGVDDKTSASIDLDTQIQVAQKLIASVNSMRRATASAARLEASAATPPAATVTEKPKAVFSPTVQIVKAVS